MHYLIDTGARAAQFLAAHGTLRTVLLWILFVAIVLALLNALNAWINARDAAWAAANPPEDAPPLRYGVDHADLGQLHRDAQDALRRREWARHHAASSGEQAMSDIPEFKLTPEKKAEMEKALKDKYPSYQKAICAVTGHQIFGYNSAGNWRVCYRCGVTQTTDQRGMPEDWVWK